ncbi:VHS-domain-containing protein [Morchella conica CCBAS932]|uniref:VHS-domain-containing protein n=1 Tax=Morchella conica CCBAS932 TaxID=1392247 RepID=A0A3N4KXJ8_9PEZI|nr:VHS-domain-containing protein [Morchella conica CCBAS932]
MAARDRFGGFPMEPNTSQLQRFIQSACDPVNFEPNLALNLEIADLINQKKGNAPREAAVAIVNYINHRNPNVSLLAIALLDICVKNCGYPFHLQISTKDFLNELVRRFPEKPPPRPTRVQLKILEAIEEWRGTICQTSRYKEDLGFIRDMHRLLSYKGYVFPEVRREDAAVLNPSDSLKSAEEMEEEERAAQSAKLQELIRRGTPADLQEANQLMKVMAGYDLASKTDYRAKAAEEVGKLRQKAKLLEEMLGKVKKGENIGQQDTFEELASALKTAQPKIQKMIEEESDDTDAVVKLLELNDIINTTVERYTFTKKGNLDAAKGLPLISGSSPPPFSEASSSAAAVETSLIDLDNDLNGGSGTSANTTGKTGSLEDDLLGLSFQESGPFGQGGGIALGFGANTGIPGPPLLSTTVQTNTAGQQNQITPSASPAPPPAQKVPPPSFPNYTSAFGSPAQQPVAISSSSQIPTSQQNGTTVNDDDEWAFTSALPPGSEQAPARNELVILNSNLHILLEANRPVTMPDGPILIKAKFSNNNSQPIQDLTFQMAVTKTLALKMQPQSGRFLQARQKDGVSQIIRVEGVARGAGGGVKMRWKASYRIGSGPINEEQGVIEGLPVA